MFPKISKGGMGGKVLQPTQHPLNLPLNPVRYSVSGCVHDMTKTTGTFTCKIILCIMLKRSDIFTTALHTHACMHMHSYPSMFSCS